MKHSKAFVILFFVETKHSDYSLSFRIKKKECKNKSKSLFHMPLYPSLFNSKASSLFLPSQLPVRLCTLPDEI